MGLPLSIPQTNVGPVDGRSVRAQRRRQARKDQILAAAKELFARRGYRDTSILAVIEQAGISRGTFYSYFDSKDELFRDLVDGLVEQMMAVVDVVDPGHGERPVRETFDNVRRLVDLLFSDRDLANVLCRVAVGVDAHVEQSINRLHAFLYDMTESALVAGAEYGHIRSVSEKIAAVAYVGSVKEVLYQFCVVVEEDAPDREEVARVLFDLVMRGLAQ